jgi:hypothetical protein
LRSIRSTAGSHRRGPVDAGLEHDERPRDLALEVVVHADDRALGDGRVAGHAASIEPVDSRCPATLITSSVRPMT